MDGACITRGTDEKCVQNFCRKPDGKRPPGRPRHRWKDIISTALTEIGQESVDWIHLAQDRDQWWVLLNTVMNLRVP
jgi:hypothetical protein